MYNPGEQAVTQSVVVGKDKVFEGNLNEEKTGELSVSGGRVDINMKQNQVKTILF